MFPFRTFLRAGVFARVLAVALLHPGIAAAQAQLDRVIVTGTREPQPLSQSAADVVVIDAATIRDSTADSVEDLLRIEAGIQLARNGGPGQTSGYFVRGASTNGTVVLIDGVVVGSASLGQASFDALTLDQIDHIEVLRGPASSLYGANAVGGVIQIFTRRGDGPPRPTAHLAGGSYRSYLGSAGISGSQGGFDYAAMIGREASGGVSAIRPNDRVGNSNPDDDGYGRNFGNLKLGYTPAAGHRIGVNVVASVLDARYDGAEFNPPDYLPDPMPDFRNHLRSTIVAIDYNASSPVHHDPQGSQNIDDAKTSGDPERVQDPARAVAGRTRPMSKTSNRCSLRVPAREGPGDVFSNEPRRNNNGLSRLCGALRRRGPAGGVRSTTTRPTATTRPAALAHRQRRRSSSCARWPHDLGADLQRSLLSGYGV
jgi:vitamin B12 transporter